SCPVYIDGQKFATLKGTYDELSAAFQKLVDDYVAAKYPRRAPGSLPPAIRISEPSRAAPPLHVIPGR
ncbi:MAG: hypothetical protein ACRD37_14115, partial [Candidatus Acidiferrales bacterium]